MVLRATGVDDLLDFLNPSSTVASLGFNLPAQVDDKDLPVEIQTDYILEPGANWVQIHTTVVNTGGTAFNIYLGEYLNGSGQVYLFQPVNGFGSPLVTAPCPNTASNPCNFVAYSGYKGGDGVSYGYVHEVPGSSTFSTSGVTVSLLGRSVALALVGFDGGPNFPLAASGNPGDSVTIDRWFVVGDGSVASITDARNQFQTIGTGTVSGNVTLGGSPVAGAQVVVLGSIAAAEAPGSTTRNVVTEALTDALGNYTLTLPPGAYTIQAARDGTPYEGGGSTPLAHPINVPAYGSVTQNIALPATGAVRVVVTDPSSQPVPAKAVIVGFDPSPVLKNSQTRADHQHQHQRVPQPWAGRRTLRHQRHALHRSDRRFGRRGARAGQLPGRGVARARVLRLQAERHRDGGRHHHGERGDRSRPRLDRLRRQRLPRALHREPGQPGVAP